MEHIIFENDFYEVKISYKGEVEATKEFRFSDYAKFYDAGCNGWDKDPEVSRMFLHCQQNYANEMLRRKGYLFLNDVYELLGIPRTRAGQVVGWIYSEYNVTGDNFVDFGIYNKYNADFVNGYVKTAVLDFNVDGNILDELKD